jgi:hypothetical protein
MFSLADAIIHEDISAVREALNFGANLNKLDEYGFTPLIEAAIANNAEIARLLIESGADVNLADSTGGVALYWAAENNNVALCELLLINGANPNMVNLAGQPVLVMPLLRQQKILRRLLHEGGANLSFAQDFINTKFLGHLFELVGTANIIAPDNQFVEVDFEGFYLEVTLGLIANSLREFNAHYSGRKIRQYKNFVTIIIDTIQRAEELIKYQQYNINLQKYENRIQHLTQQEPLIIPVGYEGHAITFIKLGNILVKCDRREDSRLYDNVVFYQIGSPENFSNELIMQLLY